MVIGGLKSLSIQSKQPEAHVVGSAHSTFFVLIFSC